MPMTSTIPKKHIEAQYDTIRELQEKCKSSKLFKGKTPDDVFIFTVYGDYTTEDGPAMVAIAKYGDTYAVYPPKYLAGKQYAILEFLSRRVESTDNLVFFSAKDMAYFARHTSHGKQLNIQLYV